MVCLDLSLLAHDLPQHFRQRRWVLGVEVDPHGPHLVPGRLGLPGSVQDRNTLEQVVRQRTLLALQ